MIEGFSAEHFTAMKVLVAKMSADLRGEHLDPADLGWIPLPVQDEVTGIANGQIIRSSDMIQAGYSLLLAVITDQARVEGRRPIDVLEDLALAVAYSESV